MWRTVGFIVIMCAVVGVNCWKYNEGCEGCRNEYSRIKRAKYYSNYSPYKFYNRYSSFNRGSFPHSYTTNDIGPLTSKMRPYKVSKRPVNEGLGDEDFQNLNTYFSNKDLDKIVELAGEKQRYYDGYRELADNYEYDMSDLHDNNIVKSIDYNEGLNFFNSPNIQPIDYNRYNNFEYHSSNNYPNTYQGQVYPQIPIHTENTKHIQQVSLLDEYIQKKVNEMSPDRNNIFTDGDTVQEEPLPKPINLREDDYDVSFTNNVPSIAKPDISSYKLENFADLPLMGFENSKLETVNSYSVPHYSVISSGNNRPRLPSPSISPFTSSLQSPSPPSSSPSILSLINAPEVEPAPPASVAKEQSDAHLKAIKIWTHKSRGTAYTLHDDGTLSLENPSQPKHKFP